MLPILSSTTPKSNKTILKNYNIKPIYKSNHLKNEQKIRIKLSTTPHATVSDFLIKKANPSELWAIADVHCEAFHPRSPFILAPLRKLDRVMSIMDGQVYNTSESGRFLCLIAKSKRMKNGINEDESDSPIYLNVIKPLFPSNIASGLGKSHDAYGILGAICIDNSGQELPSRQVLINGRYQWVREQECAYISNLAVARKARGQGIGKSLVRAAEKIGKEWGCWSVALHCDPDNKSAYYLYKNEGYVYPETSKLDFRNFRNGHRFNANRLMMKLL